MLVCPHNNYNVESDKSQCDKREKHSSPNTQLSRLLLRNIGFALGIADTDGKLEGDPVLDDAHGELRTLLHKVQVCNDWISRSEPNHVNRSEGNSQNRVSVEGEDRQVLIFLLPHENRIDIAQCKYYEKSVCRND